MVQKTTFIQKLYRILEDDDYHRWICWSAPGTSFLVLDSGEFCRQILPKVFKHNNYTSFVRQLNLYGFHKLNRSYHRHNSVSDAVRDLEPREFFHPKFIRFRTDLLGEIRRKPSTSNSNSNKSGSDALSIDSPSKDNSQSCSPVPQALTPTSELSSLPEQSPQQHYQPAEEYPPLPSAIPHDPKYHTIPYHTISAPANHHQRTYHVSPPPSIRRSSPPAQRRHHTQEQYHPYSRAMRPTVPSTILSPPSPDAYIDPMNPLTRQVTELRDTLSTVLSELRELRSHYSHHARIIADLSHSNHHNAPALPPLFPRSDDWGYRSSQPMSHHRAAFPRPPTPNEREHESDAQRPSHERYSQQREQNPLTSLVAACAPRAASSRRDW